MARAVVLGGVDLNRDKNNVLLPNLAELLHAVAEPTMLALTVLGLIMLTNLALTNLALTVLAEKAIPPGPCRAMRRPRRQLTIRTPNVMNSLSRPLRRQSGIQRE